jgi:hypothetical protein
MGTYIVSHSLLSELWQALREPVRPLESLRAKEAMKSLCRRAQQDGGMPLVRYVNEAVLLALRSAHFNEESRQELVSTIVSEEPGESALGFAQGPLFRLFTAGITLETMGLEIDSARILGLIHPRLDRLEPPMRALLEDRLSGHVRLIATASAHQKLRTLRTRSGFIIQAHLGAGLEPHRLDMYGPRYRRSREWMEPLNTGGAWTIEFRDSAGYNPCHLPRASGRV